MLSKCLSTNIKNDGKRKQKSDNIDHSPKAYGLAIRQVKTQDMSLWTIIIKQTVDGIYCGLCTSGAPLNCHQ